MDGKKHDEEILHRIREFLRTPTIHFADTFFYILRTYDTISSQKTYHMCDIKAQTID